MTKKRTPPEGRVRPSVSLAELDETLKLYNGWLSYLLKRLGEDTVWVPCGELREALETLSCRVEREGDMYVIHMRSAGTEEGGKAIE